MGIAGVVVITGASSGIGRCAAGLFARQGWRVGLVARGEAGLRAASRDVERQGAVAATARADVIDPDALEEAATCIERALGPIDVWVNCAGNGTFGRFLDIPAAEFRRVTDVTYLGTVNGTRVALRRMLPRDRGRIVNVCSAVAFRGMPLLSSYSGAKHAVRGFSQSVCAELAQDGSRVRLTTIFPPAVNTPFCDHAVSHMGRPGRPMAPVYQPEIVAEAILLAVVTGAREMPVSFTTVLFSLSTRLFPGLVDRAIHRLGYAGQLTDAATPAAPRATTLFAASDCASPVRGRFDAEARSRSLHVLILRVLARFSGRGHPRSSTVSGTAPVPRSEDKAPTFTEGTA
jgi:short-subunit dehydrogenase